MNNGAVLTVKDLQVYYDTPAGTVKAVDGISFDLRPGERLGLVGESGSGKSTMALALMRLHKPPARIAGGEVLLDGIGDVMKLDADALRRIRLDRLALVPQGAMNSLNPVMRIRDQLADGIKTHEPGDSREELAARIRAQLARVGLDAEVGGKFPHELSGGMKQRVAIAIGTSLSPSVIIADEPTSALDVVVQRQVMETLRSVQEEIGAAVVIVGHDMGLMAQFADRMGVMYAGKLVELAPVQDLFSDPQHPYTKLLIESVPTIATKRALASIPGSPPALINVPPGCPFHPRCPSAFEPCDSQVPVSMSQNGRVVACHLYPGGSGMTAFLEMVNVSKVFSSGIIRRRRTVAVDDVTMTIDEQSPSILAVAGESGSGKTTLARLLLGVIPPSSGQVIYRGQSVDDLSRAQRRTYLREIQPIFQDPFESYNPFYKVDHVLTVPAQKFQLTETKQETTRLIEESLDMVGLQPAETLGRFPHQLSGGQRQRVMVARAMLLRPRLIVADEPVSMVDASLRATILESIRRMKQELGISVVYITHDLTTAYQIADNILVMYKGSVVEAGSVDQVIRDPKHPYTQLLVSSIPQPDPSIPWGAEAEIAGDPESMEVADTGCKFVDRCPVAFDPCHGQRPPLYHEHPSRAAACFRYNDAPVLEGENLDVVFEPQLTPQSAGGSEEQSAG